MDNIENIIDINLKLYKQPNIEMNSEFYQPDEDKLEYRTNNWTFDRELNNNILNAIKREGAAIWLNDKGDLCYRLSPNGSIVTNTLDKASLVFSNFLNRNVVIKKGLAPEKEIDEVNKLYLNELTLIQKNMFYPPAKHEFFKYEKNYYRNSFIPNRYLKTFPYIQFKYSIILCYIFHLSNYDLNRFKYIMFWLSSMFSTLVKNKVSLVLIGNKQSGIDLLFNYIIKPLMGIQHSIKIDEKELSTNDLASILNEKLFYNFHNLGQDIIDKYNLSGVINDIITEDKVYIGNSKNSFEPIQIYGQTLITSYIKDLSILENSRNFTVFNVKNNVNNLILENCEIKSSINDKLTNSELIKLITNDLHNFINILKLWYIRNDSKIDFNLRNDEDINYLGFQYVFDDDDKDIISTQKIDKYESFFQAIKDKNIDYFKNVKIDKALFSDLENDFHMNKINRSNLIKYFNLIYKNEPEKHTRSLLKRLRKINENFFSKDNSKGSNGKIYYVIF